MIPWRLIAIAGAAAALLTALGWFGAWQYGRGVAAEKARWEHAQTQAQREISGAIRQVTGQNRQINTILNAAFQQGNHAIEVAANEDDAVFLRVWRDADRSLCDAADPAGGDHRA